LHSLSRDVFDSSSKKESDAARRFPVVKIDWLGQRFFPNQATQK
jgi:hypothetical protein